MKERGDSTGPGGADGADELLLADLREEEATAVAAPLARRKRETGQSIAGSGASRVSQAISSLAVGAPSTSGGGTRDSSVGTPLAALHREEVQRTRAFAVIALGIIAAVAVSLPLLGGDPLAKGVLIGGLVLAAGSIGWFLHRLRDPDAYTVGRATFVGVCMAIAAYTGVFYWGIFSPAPAVVILGIYVFSLGANFRATVFLYALCSGALAVLTVLVLGGVVADRGLVRADRLALHEQLVTQGVVQFLFLCAFVVARSSRKSTLEAVSELERAVREVSQREAQLAEARVDLDRALRIGGPGRYTEQRVGSFVLGVLIGRGGMGEVYEAVHHERGEQAAVKLLHAHVLSNPDHLRRFLREIETAQAIVSPHVARVLEVGSTAGQVPYLAMERLRGHDLAHHLRKRRRLSPSKVATLVRQAARGLEAAHAAGVVHRDIKPHNLFLAELDGERGSWKILDFGVSKLANRGGTLTKGQVVGTPGYMAPEQARGDRVDERADTYALAAIAYRALTGHPPFAGKDIPTTLYDVVYTMPAAPSTLVELPEEVDLVLAVGLAKRPADRFASPGELAAALGEGLRGALPDPLRQRATRLLADHPWGHRK